MPQPYPCKRCGGQPIYEHEPKEHVIYCTECGYHTRIHEYSTEAVKEWNSKKDDKK